MHSCPEVFDRKLGVVMTLLANLSPGGYRRALVVGCGSGREAAAIARRFDCTVDGIDISDTFFEMHDDPRVRLRVMDAQALSFDNESFDLIYSFHALEHIDDPEKALTEMNRVASPGAAFFIGTPNKSRVLGYVGSATTLKNKLLWNAHDWRMRLRGRWENRHGAHAGFTQDELERITSSAFGSGGRISDDYYAALYSRHAGLLSWLRSLHGQSLVYPAVYTAGHKT